MLALMGKRTKRISSRLRTNCLAQLKMNQFTSDCLLCTFSCKGKEKKSPSPQRAGAKASASLSLDTFFQRFKNLHAKRPGSQCWQEAVGWGGWGWEGGLRKGTKPKHKNSNICSSFQPDSLMWITQHFVPWPRTTKGCGGLWGWERCLRSGEGCPGRDECPQPRSAPSHLTGLDLLSPCPPLPRWVRCHRGTPAPHATWTVIVSALRWPLDKWCKDAQE